MAGIPGLDVLSNAPFAVVGILGPGTGYFVAGLIAYTAAKGLELADRDVFALGHIVSGHTLKRLAAAGGVMCLVAMLRKRAESPDREPSSGARVQPSTAGAIMSHRRG